MKKEKIPSKLKYPGLVILLGMLIGIVAAAIALLFSADDEMKLTPSVDLPAWHLEASRDSRKSRDGETRTGFNSTRSQIASKDSDVSLLGVKSDVTPEAFLALSPEIRREISAIGANRDYFQGFSADEASLVHEIQLKFNTGDYLNALALADAALLDQATHDFREWLNSQNGTLLTTAGWTYIRLGNCSEGVKLLKRADALERTSNIAKGLAYCYRKLGNVYAAEGYILWFIKKNPEDYSIRHLYLEILESLGDYATAAEYLMELLKRATSVGAGVAALPLAEREPLDIESLKRRLKEMESRKAESSHQQTIRSRFFTLRYRVYEHGGLGEFVLETLERSLDEFIETYGFHEPISQIEILLYPAKKFKNVVADSPDWADGVFDGRMRIPIRKEWQDEEAPSGLRLVLRHELVHALFAHMTDFRSLPPWLSEGVAQRAACEIKGCPKFRFGPKPGMFLSSEGFLSPYSSYGAVRAGLAYRQSLYLIHILENGGGTEDADENLRKVISAISVSSPLTSDSVLAPAGLTWVKLVERAKFNWEQRRAY